MKVKDAYLDQIDEYISNEKFGYDLPSQDRAVVDRLQRDMERILMGTFIEKLTETK